VSTKFIKVHLEFILPVPPEVRDSLDAVAEAGIEAIRHYLTNNVTTMVPGTLHSSWQSMPQSWRPKKHTVPIIEEEVSPGFHHVIDSEEGISFVDLTGMPDPMPTPPPTPPPPLPPAPPKELESGEEDE
jgi:hypothetical protein